MLSLISAVVTLPVSTCCRGGGGGGLSTRENAVRGRRQLSWAPGCDGQTTKPSKKRAGRRHRHLLHPQQAAAAAEVPPHANDNANTLLDEEVDEEASTSTSTSTAAAERLLLEWATADGMRMSSKVAVGADPRTNARGLVSTAPLEAGEEVIALPSGRAPQPALNYPHGFNTTLVLSVPVPVMDTRTLYCTGTLYTFSYTVSRSIRANMWSSTIGLHRL